MEGRICKNQEYGQHIRVRCRGCGSLHSTKNIGDRDDNNVVSMRRSLFDVTYCTCLDKHEHPLVHDCDIDDKLSQERASL